MAYFTFTQRGSLVSLLDGLTSSCRQVDPNNGGPKSTIINEPTQYEVVVSGRKLWTGTYVRVLNFDPKKLSRTEKYGTTSYNFGSIEFYAGGYYLGHSFINKTYQKLIPQSGGASVSISGTSIIMPAPLALAIVTANGFLPSVDLLAAQPIDPEDPNAQTVSVLWLVNYIVPAPSVTLEVMLP